MESTLASQLLAAGKCQSSKSLAFSLEGHFTNHLRTSVLVRPALQVLGELVAMVMGTHLPALYVGRQQMAGCIGTAGPGAEYPSHGGAWTPMHPYMWWDLGRQLDFPTAGFSGLPSGPSLVFWFHSAVASMCALSPSLPALFSRASSSTPFPCFEKST